MDILNFFKIIFAIIAIVATTYIFPIITAICCHENFWIFAVPMFCAWAAFFAIYMFTRKRPIKLTIKSTFVIVASAWISCSVFGAIPFLLSGYFHSITDAFFESVSGFTTTGATILSDVECLPRSLNLWRCETHWLGGMGIVALTVALFPLLGVGGFQLIKAETTGPEKGKVTPKITTTAKILWLIYFLLTLALFVALKICGMDVIDALSHAFSTLGSGGFSTRNASIAAYNSPAIEWIITLFMFFAGVNFSLFFYLFTGKFSEIKSNSEFKTYVTLFILIIFSVALIIRTTGAPMAGNPEGYKNFGEALRYSAFQVASIISTTGFSTCNYTDWIPAAQFLIFILFFIGGSSGSTGGGIKVVRLVILVKQVKNEMLKMLHPHGIFTVRLNQKVGRKDVVFSVASFITIYAILVFVTTFFGCLLGPDLDIFSAFTGALSMVGNVGPAFGKLNPAANCGFLNPGLKWIYMFAMLAGRLELYTMLMFLIRDFWKK